MISISNIVILVVVAIVLYFIYTTMDLNHVKKV